MGLQTRFRYFPHTLQSRFHDDGEREMAAALSILSCFPFGQVEKSLAKWGRAGEDLREDVYIVGAGS